MKLFVGLGNPGREYESHRHNAGFMAVDRIAKMQGLGPWKRKFQGLACDGEIAGHKVMLLKPQTYMNESGRAVGEAQRFLKIPLADIVVLYDEIDLAPGKLKVKRGGGNAGHNGLRSITAHCGNEYERVRIGVGHPGAKELVARYVLSDFAKADGAWLDPLLDAIARSAARLAAGDAVRFLTDVARLTGEAGDAGARPAVQAPERAPRPVTTPSPDPRPQASVPHPAGERAGKRQSAIADNLRKWLAGRDTKE